MYNIQKNYGCFLMLPRAVVSQRYRIVVSQTVAFYHIRMGKTQHRGYCSQQPPAILTFQVLVSAEDLSI